MQKRNPWVYVPTLYFAEGLPYTIVMMMSAVYFKDLGADNVLIGLTSALQLPWIFKFAWAPLIDFFGKKKHWIVVAQVVLTAFFFLLALSTISPDPVWFGIAVLALIAVASATHDASIDGYYLEVLSKPEQALFVGVRNTAYRMSMLFGNGAMVCLAGFLAPQMGKTQGWLTAYIVLAAVMAGAAALHSFYLPAKTTLLDTNESLKVNETVRAGVAERPGISRPERATHAACEEAKFDHPEAQPSRDYFWAILSYFKQPGIVSIVFYILLFRLGDALVMKQIPPFLQDSLEKGGMALSVQSIGIVYGTVGVGFLLLGGIVGGYLVSKQGIKTWLWPATLIMNGTILLYWLLALTRPEMFWVYVVNSLEQFGYGLGMAAYTVFLLGTVKQEYKAAHYAVATALMALGLMIPGMASGYMYNALGYANFFLVSFFLSIPGVISIFFLPIWKKDSEQINT